jgi:membrane carboxypeptidase/penicillin-binding protein
MRRLWSRKSAVMCLLVVAAMVVGYYTAAVVVARSKTPGIVTSYYASGAIKTPAKSLSKRQLEILLKVEDPSFYHHHGVDFTTPGAGWTTITQALAKEFYFSEFRQGVMKIAQTLYARFALDPLVSKEQQLDIFVNTLYYGNDTYGLFDAARYYYNKTPSELNEDEFISLIGSLVAPNELNVEDHPKENSERVRRIKRVLDGTYAPEGLFDIMYDRK